MSSVTEVTFGRYAEVVAVLSDPRFEVPRPPAGNWLRDNVSRFTNGPSHAHRRRLATAELERLSPARLRREAAAATRLALPSAEETIARTVPAQVLAVALGLRLAVADEVAVLARGYHPGTDAGPAATGALAHLVHACGGVWDERAAARIGLLVQAADATAGLVVNAVAAWRRWRPAGSVPAVLAETLRFDPPVRVQRRICVAAAVVGATPVEPGSLVSLDLVRANRDPAVFVDPDRFDPARSADRLLTLGAGLRPCPGRDHAFAIATGIVEEIIHNG